MNATESVWRLPMRSSELDAEFVLGAAPRRATHAAKLGLSLALTFFLVGYGGSHLSVRLMRDDDASELHTAALSAADTALPTSSIGGSTTGTAMWMGAPAFRADLDSTCRR